MPNQRKQTRAAFINAKSLRRNLTDAETKLWQALRAHQLQSAHFRRQHPIGSYIADFCAPRQKLIIEVDGGQHLEQAAYDAERTAYFETHGYRVLRFWNHEVLQDLDTVLTVIIDALPDHPQ